MVISGRLRDTSNEHYQLLANDTAETINAWLSAKQEILVNQRASIETIDDFSTCYQNGDTKDESDLPPMDPEEFREMLEMIAELAERYDQDGILRLLGQTEEYALSDEDKTLISKVKKSTLGGDWSALEACL